MAVTGTRPRPPVAAPREELEEVPPARGARVEEEEEAVLVLVLVAASI